MRKIANENNLAETAFFVRTGPGKYDLRWFTPESEVDLCGHATARQRLGDLHRARSELKSVAFETRSGTLVVDRGRGGNHVMSMPSDPVTPYEEHDGFARQIGEALGIAPPDELYKGRYILGVWNEPGRGARDQGLRQHRRRAAPARPVGDDRVRARRSRQSWGLRFHLALLRPRQGACRRTRSQARRIAR